MKRTCLALALSALGLWAPAALALDDGYVKHALGAEPTYRDQAPQYCLLVFGKEEKTRVWLVVDGDALHVSNSKGELVGAGSRVVLFRGGFGFPVGDITELDGKTSHHGLRVSREKDESWRLFLTLADGRRQGAGYDPAEKLRFAARPQDAPVVHFNGPLAIQFSGPKQTLDRSEVGSTIRLGLGTPGRGEGTFAALQGCAVPDRGPITADIEFPADAESEDLLKVQATIRNRH